MKSFKQAWNEAKKSGKALFNWNGKLYNTASEEDLKSQKGDTEKQKMINYLNSIRSKYTDLDAFLGGSPQYRSGNQWGGWTVDNGDQAVSDRVNAFQDANTTVTPYGDIGTVDNIYQPQTNMKMFTDDDIRALNFNNYGSLLNAANNSANDNNAFMIALKRRYGNDTSKWNQQQIENDLGIRGTYRRFGGGDFGDMSRAMASYIGTWNGRNDGMAQNYSKQGLPTSPVQNQQSVTQQPTADWTQTYQNTAIEPEQNSAAKQDADSNSQPRKTTSSNKKTVKKPVVQSSKAVVSTPNSQGTVLNDVTVTAKRTSKANLPTGDGYTLKKQKDGTTVSQFTSHSLLGGNKTYTYYNNGRVRMPDGTMKNYTFKKGNLNIYKSGGTMDNQDEVQKAFTAYLMQLSKSETPQQLEDFIQSLGEEGLKQAYQNFIEQYGEKIRSAKMGAKLQYIKSLKIGGGVYNEDRQLEVPLDKILSSMDNGLLNDIVAYGGNTKAKWAKYMQNKLYNSVKGLDWGSVNPDDIIKGLLNNEGFREAAYQYALKNQKPIGSAQLMIQPTYEHPAQMNPYEENPMFYDQHPRYQKGGAIGFRPIQKQKEGSTIDNFKKEFGSKKKAKKIGKGCLIPKNKKFCKGKKIK